MPDISSNLGLNLPKGTDVFDYDVHLRQNFQKIDDQLKSNIIKTYTAAAGQTLVTLDHPVYLRYRSAKCRSGRCSSVCGERVY
jgi:hypothetical protein